MENSERMNNKESLLMFENWKTARLFNDFMITQKIKAYNKILKETIDTNNNYYHTFIYVPAHFIHLDLLNKFCEYVEDINKNREHPKGCPTNGETLEIKEDRPQKIKLSSIVIINHSITERDEEKINKYEDLCDMSDTPISLNELSRYWINTGYREIIKCVVNYNKPSEYKEILKISSDMSGDLVFNLS